jgi:hypothetical protein
MLSTLKACALPHRRASTSRGARGIAKSPVQTKPQIERAISYRLAIQNAHVTAITDLLPGHFDHSKRAPLNRFRRTILSGDLSVSRTTSAPPKLRLIYSIIPASYRPRPLSRGFLPFGMFVQRTQEGWLAASWRANSVIQMFALPKERQSEYRDGPLSTSRFSILPPIVFRCPVK